MNFNITLEEALALKHLLVWTNSRNTILKPGMRGVLDISNDIEKRLDELINKPVETVEKSTIEKSVTNEQPICSTCNSKIHINKVCNCPTGEY